jgi:hypothetical protein
VSGYVEYQSVVFVWNLHCLSLKLFKFRVEGLNALLLDVDLAKVRDFTEVLRQKRK